MNNIIKKLVNQVLLEMVEDDVTVYFDMDGVLADFSSAVHSNQEVRKAEEELDALLSRQPELRKLEHDDLKELLRGEQEDPFLKALKKAFKEYNRRMYSVASKPGHFINLDMLPGAEQLLKGAMKITGKRPHILTAPMTKNPNCENEKLEWIQKNLSGLYDNFYCTKDKQQFALSEKDILVDDRPKYVNKFRAQGGTAIQHTSVPETLKELEEIVKKLKSL